MVDNEGVPKEQLRRHAIYRKPKSLDQSGGHYGSGYCSLAHQTGIDKEVLEKLHSATVTLQSQMDSVKCQIEQIQKTVQDLIDQQNNNVVCHQCHQTKTCNRVHSETVSATITNNDVSSDSNNYSLDSKETEDPLYDNNVNVKANLLVKKFSNPIYERFQEHDSDTIVYAHVNALENVKNLEPTSTALCEMSQSDEKTMSTKSYSSTPSHNSSMEADISTTEVKMRVSHPDNTLTSISPSTSLKKPVPTPRTIACPGRSTSLQTRAKTVTEVKQRPQTVIQQKQDLEFDERECLANAFQFHITDLVDGIVFTESELPDWLISEECFTEDECSNVRKICDRKDQIRILISMIKGRDLKVLHKFLGQINRHNHEIAEKVRAKFERNKQEGIKGKLCAYCKLKKEVNIKLVADTLWADKAIEDGLYNKIIFTSNPVIRSGGRSFKVFICMTLRGVKSQTNCFFKHFPQRMDYPTTSVECSRC